MELPFFYLFAAGIIGASILMVTRANVIHAALLLVLTFFFLSGVYVLAGAEFLAVVQILLYAGGIMVLYLFSIMLMNVDVSVRLRQFHRQSVFALAAAVLLAVEVLIVLSRGSSYPALKGFAWPEGAVVKLGFHKLIKYRVYPGFYRSSSMAIVNLDKFNSLPKQIQELLVKVGIDFEKRSQSVLRKKADIDNEKLFKAGMKKYELKGEVRKSYLETVYGSKWRDNEKRKYVVPFEKLKAKMYVRGGA